MTEEKLSVPENEKRHTEEYFRSIIKNDRAFKIFSYRMGYTDGVRHSIEETTKKFNISRERVRQVESKAFRTGCHITRRKRLIDFLD